MLLGRHLDGDVVREQIPWKSLIRSCRQQLGGFKPCVAAWAGAGQAVVGPEARRVIAIGAWKTPWKHLRIYTPIENHLLEMEPKNWQYVLMQDRYPPRPCWNIELLARSKEKCRRNFRMDMFCHRHIVALVVSRNPKINTVRVPRPDISTNKTS